MEWTKDLPTKPGLYLFQKNGEWVCRFGAVEKGRWEDRQNPNWLYFERQVLSTLYGSWFGPIPQPPNKTH